jgi:hypothetical protein
MITNEQEFIATLAHWKGEGLGVRASGYRLEIERMQAEEMEYLLHPPATERQPQPA